MVGFQDQNPLWIGFLIAWNHHWDKAGFPGGGETDAVGGQLIQIGTVHGNHFPSARTIMMDLSFDK